MSGAITSTHSAPAATDALAATAKERAALTKPRQTYQADINKGQSAQSLDALARQIAAAGKALGQNVTLPKASISTSVAAGLVSTPLAVPPIIQRSTSRPDGRGVRRPSYVQGQM